VPDKYFNTRKNCSLFLPPHNKEKQESLANAKVSARQPWYIGRNSLNRPSLRNAKQYQRNLQGAAKKSNPLSYFANFLATA